MSDIAYAKMDGDWPVLVTDTGRVIRPAEVLLNWSIHSPDTVDVGHLGKTEHVPVGPPMLVITLQIPMEIDDAS